MKFVERNGKMVRFKGRKGGFEKSREGQGSDRSSEVLHCRAVRARMTRDEIQEFLSSAGDPDGSEQADNPTVAV